MIKETNKEIKSNVFSENEDINHVLVQVNLKRLKNNDTIINQDRINKLNNIRESIAMLEQQE